MLFQQGGEVWNVVQPRSFDVHSTAMKSASQYGFHHSSVCAADGGNN